MKKNFKGILKTIEQATKKHSPEILLGFGIAGGISTTILAVKATPKALMLLEEEKRERRKNGEDTKIKPLDAVKTAWKPYVPSAITGVASIACVIGAHSVNVKRNAAIATAYKLTETAFSEYRDAVIEQIGEKKEQEVIDKVAAKKVKETGPQQEVIVTGSNKVLFLDSISSRYFESDLQTVRKVVNDLNHQLLTQDYFSLNEFYYDLGLKETKMGDELGWNINDGMVDIRYSSQITEDGRPCIVLNYKVAPRYDFSKLM